MYHIFKREENARHERTNCLYFDVEQKNVVPLIYSACMFDCTMGAGVMCSIGCSSYCSF